MKSKHKTPDELRDWMGRIYDRCEVLESTPMPAASDAKASTGSVGQVQRRLPGTPSPAKQPSSEQAPDVKKIKVRADGDLHSLLGRMHDRCQVLESTPMPAASDAKECKTGNNHPHVEVSLATVCAAPSPAKARLEARFEVPGGKKLRDDDDLHSWMAQLRGRCKVLESNPSAVTADAASYSVSLQDAVKPEIFEMAASTPTPPVVCVANDEVSLWGAAKPETNLEIAASTATPLDVCAASYDASLQDAPTPEAFRKAAGTSTPLKVCAANYDASLQDATKPETLKIAAGTAKPLDVGAASYDASLQDAAKPETFEMAASTTPVGLYKHLISMQEALAQEQPDFFSEESLTDEQWIHPPPPQAQAALWACLVCQHNCAPVDQNFPVCDACHEDLDEKSSASRTALCLLCQQNCDTPPVHWSFPLCAACDAHCS